MAYLLGQNASVKFYIKKIHIKQNMNSAIGLILI